VNISNILIALDSFKGSGSSKELGSYTKQGVLEILPNANIKVIEIADGGEGTLDAIMSKKKGDTIELNAHDLLGELIPVRFGLLDGEIAIIEAAQTIGLTLRKANKVCALKGSSFGVGEQIIQALDYGAKHIFIGLGGTATNDGGMGMARALGVEFFDKLGNPVEEGLVGLKDIAKIDLEKLDPRIKNTTFTILSDVENPLVGKTGAIYFFGEQKGLDINQLDKYDEWMSSYGGILEIEFSFNKKESIGAGAAGGLGAALQTFCQAQHKNGIEEILKLIDFEENVKQADLIFTGEGRMDEQSLFGKAPVGIGRIAKKYNKPVIALVGGKNGKLDSIYNQGISCVLPIVTQPMTLEKAIENTKAGVIETTKTVLRCIDIGFLMEKSNS